MRTSFFLSKTDLKTNECPMIHKIPSDEDIIYIHIALYPFSIHDEF